MKISVSNKRNLWATTLAIASTLTLASIASAAPTTVKVTVENIAPEEGLIITPVWVGFHDGSFDFFDLNKPASASLETLAENGITDMLAMDLKNSGSGMIEGTMTGPGFRDDPHPVIPPGATVTMTFTVDSNRDRYLSYAAMLVPSNDAFIGNDTPIEIFDQSGHFKGADLIVTGNGIWDAGTEVNDEVPQNTALLGQVMPNVGETENGTVMYHPGFMSDGNILTAFPKANFMNPSASNYQLARIRIEQVR